MRVSEQTENQIMAVLQRMAEAVADKDPDGVMALLDPDFLFIGPGEKALGVNGFCRRLERDFSRAETISVSLSDVLISAEGTVAWIVADLTCRIVAGGTPEAHGARMTAVLRGTGHTWIFARVHISTMTA